MTLLFVYNLESDFAPLLKSAHSQEAEVDESFGTQSEALMINLDLKVLWVDSGAGTEGGGWRVTCRITALPPPVDSAVPSVQCKPKEPHLGLVVGYAELAVSGGQAMLAPPVETHPQGELTARRDQCGCETVLKVQNQEEMASPSPGESLSIWDSLSFQPSATLSMEQHLGVNSAHSHSYRWNKPHLAQRHFQLHLKVSGSLTINS
ncbi:hypothetical protein EK904_004927 [Melospiza melodia maxima]|nr:hypothetical protein EK904_004927 [Melospiza melodia maxima]